jgi:clan AA aspartic protease (TIGR02281 family)
MKEKRRLKRAVPDPNHPIRVDINGESFLDIAHAADISEEGICLASPNCLDACMPDEAVTVVISLPPPVGKTFKLEGSIRHISGDRFGVVYTDISEKNRACIRSYIDSRPPHAYPAPKPPGLSQTIPTIRNIFIGCLLLGLCAFFGWKSLTWWSASKSDSFTARQSSSETIGSSIPGPKTKERTAVTQPRVPILPQTPPQALPKILSTGSTAIYDPYGRIIARVRTSVVGNGWIALPTRYCFGGAKWIFQSESGVSVAVAGGIWQEEVPLSIWQLENPRALSSLEIHPLDRNAPLQWQALDQDRAVAASDISADRGTGYFISTDAPVFFHGAGVFKQGDRVVGWTFDELPGKGYFWSGPAGGDLYAELSVDNFYTMTFAHSREEQFAAAMAMSDDEPPADRLSAFVEGFYLPFALQEEQRPAHLKNDPIHSWLESIVSGMIKNAEYRPVADSLGRRAVMPELNEYLQEAVIFSTFEAYGRPEAIALAESVFGRSEKIENMLKALYLEQIAEFIQQKDVSGVRNVLDAARTQYPEDPQLYLLGVELALLENDWRKAESLLLGRSFPDRFRDRAFVLESRISEMKKSETRIRLPIDSGSGFIKADVLLNQAIPQTMIVDTGASMVTIPYAAAEALGLEISNTTPTRYVQTVAGTTLAYQVVIPSITLQGVTVYNVAALVLTSNQIGLLGNNFLRHFDMESDTGGGVVNLYPK